MRRWKVEIEGVGDGGVRSAFQKLLMEAGS